MYKRQSVSYGFPILRPLQEEIIKRGEEVVWFLEEENLNKYLKKREKQLTTVQSVLDYKPDIILVASNTVPHFFPGIKVQVFHGFSVNKRSKEKGHFRIRGFFDLYCTQGPSTTNEFKRLANKFKHFKVVETGWPKVDILFPVKKNNRNRPVVFLASTFTESLSLAYDDDFFKEIIRLVENKEWDWIINLHPKMNSTTVQKFKTLRKYNNVTYIDYLEDLKLLKEADILITDTTSVITEFIIQGKPVITYKNNLPQSHMINITNVKDLEKACNIGFNPTEDLQKNIKNFINQEHPYFDGKSSERVIKEVVLFFKNKGVTKLKRKPFNLVRKITLRLKMNYFK